MVKSIYHYSGLKRNQTYLQLAFNSDINTALNIIAQLPRSPKIIIEAGTPLIKQYGQQAIQRLSLAYKARLGQISGLKQLLSGLEMQNIVQAPRKPVSWWNTVWENKSPLADQTAIKPVQQAVPMAYVVADLKTIDRGETEVRIAAQAGAQAAVAMGTAPTETLDRFIQACIDHQIDPMIDMMNVSYPLSVLRQLKIPPRVVILHRGVDEEQFNKEKQLPLYEIRRIKSQYNDVLISVAGGDTIREVQSAVFNDADIVVVWKSVYQNNQDTLKLVDGFLKEIK